MALKRLKFYEQPVTCVCGLGIVRDDFTCEFILMGTKLDLDSITFGIFVAVGYVLIIPIS